MGEPVPTHALVVQMVAEILPTGEPHFSSAFLVQSQRRFTERRAEATVLPGRKALRFASRLNQRHAVHDPSRRLFYMVARAVVPSAEKQASAPTWRDRAANCGVE